MGTEDPPRQDPQNEAEKAENSEPKFVQDLVKGKLVQTIKELKSNFDWLTELADQESRDGISISPQAERLFLQLKLITDEVAQEPVVDRSKIRIRNKLLSKVKNAQRSIADSMSTPI